MGFMNLFNCKIGKSHSYLAIKALILFISMFILSYQTCLAKDNVIPYSKKDAYVRLPLLFKGYDELINMYSGSSYIYPGSFAMDDNYIYIQYVFEPKQKDNVIVLYDHQGKYKGYFLIDSGGKGNAGEGLSIQAIDNFNTRIYVASNNGFMKAYLFQHNFQKKRLEKISEKYIGVYNQFSYRNGRWLIEHYNNQRDIHINRTDLNLTDDYFNVIREIKLPLSYSGFITNDANKDAKLYNKRQGLALGDFYFVAGYGAFYYSKIKASKNTYQGIRVFDLSGGVIYQKIIEPQVFINTLIKNGFNASRIENEGVFVSNNNKIIYSLYVYSDRFHKKTATREGIVILMDELN